MTSSIVYTHTEDYPTTATNTQQVFATYPNRTSFSVNRVVTYIPRENSSMRISFAPGTQFDFKNRSKVADKVRKTKYTFKPVPLKCQGPVLYRAPASTMPSSHLVSTTQQDYKAPSQHMRRSLNPPPKWFHRSASDLLVSRAGVDTSIQLQKDAAKAQAMTQDIEPIEEEENKKKPEFRSTKSLFIPERPRRSAGNDNFLMWELSEEGGAQRNNIPKYKPLVGDIDGRLIERARLYREVQLPRRSDHMTDIQPIVSENKKKDVRRTISFTESQKPYQIYVPSSHESKQAVSKTRGGHMNVENSRSLTNVASADAAVGTEPLRRENTSVESFSNSMQRTYEKQAILKDMIQN